MSYQIALQRNYSSYTFGNLLQFVPAGNWQVDLLNQLYVIQQWYEGSEIWVADPSVSLPS